MTQLWCRDESRIPDLLEKAARGELQEVDEETVIEAVEHKAYPFFGLQWHPELGKEHLCSEIDTLRIRDYFYQLIKESQQVL